MTKNPWVGTSFHDDVIDATYDELVEKIGEPTFTEKSSDDKVQKEWQLMTDDGVAFTIYDWKEYDRDVTDGESIRWHVGYHGGLSNQAAIVSYMQKRDLRVTRYTWYKV